MPGKFLSLYRAGRVARADARAVASRGAAYTQRRNYAASRQLNRRLNQSSGREKNYIDVAAANYACDTTGSITHLGVVAPGTGVTQRIGKKIVWDSIQCRGVMRSNTTTTYSDQTFMLVYDKRPGAAVPAITDILNTANSVSMNNDVNSGRFVILKRVDFTCVGNVTTPATGMECYNSDFFLPLKKRPCVYKAGGTGAMGDIEQGSLYLVTVGDNVAGTAAGTLTAGFRIRFTDI